jgi:hypothetical protein
MSDLPFFYWCFNTELPVVKYRLYFTYFVSLALKQSAGYDLLVLRGFLITHDDVPQSVGPSGQVISSSQRPLPDNTQHTQNKH